MIGPSFAARLFVTLLFAGGALCALAGAEGRASNLPPGFREDRFLSDLVTPTAVAFAPDGRIFAAEKPGRIVVYSHLGDSTKSVAADLRKQVYDTGDRGLLSIAIDPAFPTRPYLYALYSFDHVIGADLPGDFPHWGQPPNYEGDPCPIPPESTADACAVSGRLVRLTVTEGGAGNSVVKSGGAPLEHVLIGEDWCQQFSSHSVGDLQFDPDGNLYVSGGDGASFNVTDYGGLGFPGEENRCEDPPGGVGDVLEPPTAEGGALRSQDLRTSGDPTGLSGTVIRIDPDTGAGVPGNPLFGSLDENERRIVAYGFRNPFRFTLDPDHGDLYVANVGWGSYEELDRVPAVPAGPPANSGWPCYEGPGPNPAYQNLGLDLCEDLYAEEDATVEPLLFYKHKTPLTPEDGCSPQPGSAAAGVFIYPGGEFPDAYDGSLFFADTVRGCIWTMAAGEDGRPDPATVAPFLTEGGIYPGADFLIGPEGDFFYLKFYGEEDQGSLRRVSYDPDSPRARLGADVVYGDSPLEVELDAGASTDPDGEALTYAWDLDDDGVFETPGGAQLTETFSEGLDPEHPNVVVRVRVKDLSGRTDVANLTLYPGDTPPEPVIETPVGEWAVGEEISFSGFAADAEDDEGGEPGSGLGDAGLYWRTELYHCPDACHAHPLRNFPGVYGGSFSAPDHDYPAYLKVILTATDSRGLTSTKELALFPRAVDLRIESYPPGVEIGAGVDEDVAPYTLRAIEYGKVTLAAPPTAVIDGVEEKFLRWSQGGPRVQTVVADADRTYTAFYREPPAEEPPPPPPPPVKPSSRWSFKPPKRTTAATARFAFTGKPEGARFQCRLDGRPWAGCRSPRVYRNLKAGWHALRLRAIALDGTVEATPSLYRWRVEATRR